MTDIKCHEKFKRCIKKVHKSRKVGFSKQCPYDTDVPTMVQGMDLAILLSQFGNSKLELWFAEEETFPRSGIIYSTPTYNLSPTPVKRGVELFWYKWTNYDRVNGSSDTWFCVALLTRIPSFLHLILIPELCDYWHEFDNWLAPKILFLTVCIMYRKRVGFALIFSFWVIMSWLCSK